MKSYFEARGNVRGTCGHKHQTEAAAEKCCKRDMDGCKTQGGYSDRFVSEVEYTPLAKFIERRGELQVRAGEKGRGKLLSFSYWSGNLGRGEAIAAVLREAEEQGYEVIYADDE